MTKVSQSLGECCRRWGQWLAVGLLASWLTACRPGAGAAEEADQNIRTGLAYQSAKLYPDAEKAFQRALQNHPNSAEAHKRLGLLYFQDIKDYVGALYHLDRHARLARDDQGLKHVTDACKQEIAKLVPLGDITLELRREATDVARKNQQLTEEVARLRQQVAELSARTTEPGRITREPDPTRTSPVQSVQSRVDTAVQTESNRSLAPRTPAQSSRRSHRIQTGDTIYSLGRRYRVEPRDILRANPSIDPRNLQIGQEIILPNP